MTVQEIKESYTICGLVCSFCVYGPDCPGCRCKNEYCEIKACCIKKGLNYCFECEEYPCGKDMHKKLRLRAFNTVAGTEGLDKLAEYLYTNYKRGIMYHRDGRLTGDYDRCRTVEGVIYMLKNGRPDPYDVCPGYESRHFQLRLVSHDDAADLLLCYSDPEAQANFNSDNCTSDFCFSSIDEMERCIEEWLGAYKMKQYARFSIIDRKSGKAVGTTEIFDGGIHGHSVLRIDIQSKYENRELIGELLGMADGFFNDFGCNRIVIKAGPWATERILALTDHGYTSCPVNSEWERKDY